MAERYQFQYYPVTGKLTGNQMIEQTEQAINELAQNVYEGSAQVEVINTIVNQAEQNSEQALAKATQALESTGRVYIDELTAVNLNNYYNSELLYIGDETSENLPVADTGFLEVKTNDSMTNAAQVFIADSSGLLYFRQATIIPQEVGSVTTYDVTWGTWFTYATQEYVGDNYLSLTGGAITGNLSVGGTITGDLVGNATNDGNGNEIATTYLPLSGGTMTGEITFAAGNKRILTAGYASYFGLCSGESGYSGGGNAYFWGKDFSDSSTAGCFRFAANNGTNVKELLGKPDGTLTWGGKAIIVGTEYSESFTVSSINAGATTNVGTLAHTPKYFTVLYNSGSNWATTTVSVNTAGAIWVKNNHTSTLTNIKFTVNYIS